MTGIYGFASQKTLPLPSQVLDKMLGAVSLPGPPIQQQWIDQTGHAGLGVIHPARTNPPGHFAHDATNGVVCIMDGVLYRETDANHPDPVEPDGAAVLLSYYLEHNTERLREINGSFSAAWWDPQEDRLILANDKLGHRLLFFTFQKGVLVFASMLARIMATDLFSPKIDARGLADLLSYAHTLGERTLFKEVHLLPPGSLLSYHNGKIQIQRYWSLDRIEIRGQYDEQRLDELEKALKGAVKRAIRPDLTCAVALTGGIDSRCLVAAAVDQELPFITHTGGQPDSTDVVLAQQVAARAGVPHVFRTINEPKLSDWLFSMVLWQGGIVATLHSQTFGLFDDPPPFDAQVQGIAGEIARGTWLTPSELNIRDLTSTKKSLSKRVSTKTARCLDWEKLWQLKFRPHAKTSPRGHMDAVLSSYDPPGSPLLLYDYFGLNEHTRKQLNKGTLIVRGAIEDYAPYADHGWLEAILAVPVTERVGKRIQIDLLKRLHPALLDVPYANNLIPLSASPRKAWLVKRYRAVKRRLSRRFKAIESPAKKIPTAKDWQWTRNQMRSFLTALLYDPDAAFRSYLCWEVVKPLLNQHFSGQEEWRNLVSALTVFEIAHKLWME